MAAHENAVKKDLWVLSGEMWAWTRHANDEALPHWGHFRSLKRFTAMIASARDEGRSGCLEREQALLCQTYTVCGSAAKDPSEAAGQKGKGKGRDGDNPA